MFEVRADHDGCTPGQYAVTENGTLSACFATEAEAAQSADQANFDAGFRVPVQNADGEWPWEGVIAYTGQNTGDGRILSQAGGKIPSLPRDLAVQTELQPGHDGAEIGGRIDTMDIRDDGTVWATGVFENTPFGELSAMRVGRQTLNGISVDLRDVKSEPVNPVYDEDGFIIDYEAMMFLEWTIMGATVVMHPAFVDAQIHLAGEPPALVAAGSLPAEWFQDPELQDRTLLQVDGDRIFGHIAAWGACHTGSPGACVTAPHSAADYGWFKQGRVETDAGTIPTGVYTFHTDHASKVLGSQASADHYAHSGLAAADVNIGEDAYGIWIAGALRPGLSEDARREILASAPSGDWRRIDGHLELVGILAVNEPGFPIPMPQYLAASGAPDEPEEVVTLFTAAGLQSLAASAEPCVCHHKPKFGSKNLTGLKLKRIPGVDEIIASAAELAELRQEVTRLGNLMASAFGDQVIATYMDRIAPKD